MTARAVRPPSRLNAWLVKAAARLLARSFYGKIEARGVERFPEAGPVLLTANHPNALLDAIVIGSVTRRRIHFVAKHTLFDTPLRPLLRWLGVVPIRRRHDLPGGVRGAEPLENVEAFEACFAVLASGGVVGIFPEGTTHDAPHLAPMRTGAARIALGSEARANFGQGLLVVPVGLYFPRKAVFRSDALVVFGEPIRVADWKESHGLDERSAVLELTAEIGGRLASLLPSVADEDADVARAVLAIYADRIPVPSDLALSPPAETEHFRARQIAAALAHLRARDPEYVERIATQIRAYRRLLGRLRVSDRALAATLSPAALRDEAPLALLFLLGLPLALYGLVNHFLASRGIALAVRIGSPRGERALFAVSRVVGGLVFLPLTYALQGFVIERLAGWGTAIAYVASCPPTGIFAWWYFRRLARAAVTLKQGTFLLNHRLLLRGLLRRRGRLRRALDEARDRYLAETRAVEARDSRPSG